MKKPRSATRSARSLIRPLVRQLHPYVPGEQPKIPGLLKLNTNENAFPPAPAVLAAVRAAADGRLRLYPNPTAELLRDKLARFHGCDPDNIIVGNGSDELLALAVRAFVEPLFSARDANLERWGWDGIGSSDCGLVQYFTPSYSLYPVLAEMHGARRNPVALRSDFALPTLKDLRQERRWNFRAGLSYITTPNAPSGYGYSTAELEALCRLQRGVVVLDEAYVDFASENAMNLALKYPHVLVARTFSKAYSLCFLRIGYFVGHRNLIAALQKIRDSYNVNGLAQIAAEKTLSDLAYYRANFRRIIATRERLTKELRRQGFEVFPSQTNFILARPPVFPAEQWLEKLRQKRILVRWFGSPELRHYLRMTVGTDAQADTLLAASSAILSRRIARS